MPGSNGQKAANLGQEESPLPSPHWASLAATQRASQAMEHFACSWRLVAFLMRRPPSALLTLMPSMRNPRVLVELSDSRHCM